jgi:hypothetical protein
MFGNPWGGGFKGSYNPGALNANELSSLLFLASTPAFKPAQADWMITNLYTQANFTNLLKDDKAGSAYRKVFFHYLDVRMDDNTLNQCAWLFTQLRMKEGADILAKAIRDGKGTQPYSKAHAMCGVGTLGGKEHVKVFEPLLKDETVVQALFKPGGQRGSIKVRDVALAMTIHLSGKNPKDFGFSTWAVYPNQLIQYHQLGFETDEARATAFKRWDEESKKPKPKTKK